MAECAPHARPGVSLTRPAVSEAAHRFFADCVGAFQGAADATGQVRRSFQIAGRGVHIVGAGPDLIDRLTPALAHLGRPAEKELLIRVFDTDSTGTPMPPPPWAPRHYTGRGDVSLFNDGRFFTSYGRGSRDLSMLDRETGQALFWIPDAAGLPFHEAAAPLRTIFNAWFGSHHTPLLHAGAVGAGGGGVLIVGPGGRGKSTLALSAALAGMGYAGDDYVLVQSQPEPYVHSLYRTAKLEVDHLTRMFPDLATRLRTADPVASGKRIFFADNPAGAEVCDGFALRAFVVPELDAARTAIRPAPPGEVMRTALPSTITQLAGSGKDTFADLAALLREIPSYVLELGPDSLTAAPQALRELSLGSC